MDATIAMNLINICASSMLLCSILSMAMLRMPPMVRLFSIQSIFLGVMAAVVAYYYNEPHIYIMCGLTIIIKGIIIPKVLDNVLEKVDIVKEAKLKIGIAGSLLVCAALIFVSYYVTEPFIMKFDTMESSCLALSMSIVLIGLLMMASRRKAITEVIGLLMMENGLFLGALSISHGMPLIVEIAAFFDVLVALVIIGVFVLRINRSFHSTDVADLRRLKE